MGESSVVSRGHNFIRTHTEITIFDRLDEKNNFKVAKKFHFLRILKSDFEKGWTNARGLSGTYGRAVYRNFKWLWRRKLIDFILSILCMDFDNF